VRIRGCFRVSDQLDQAKAVAQVNKDQAAMVAAAVHPPRKSDFFPCMCSTQFAAGMRFHHVSILQKITNFQYTNKKPVGAILKPRRAKFCEKLLFIQAACRVQPDAADSNYCYFREQKSGQNHFLQTCSDYSIKPFCSKRI
jgi:hypothetical protein